MDVSSPTPAKEPSPLQASPSPAPSEEESVELILKDISAQQLLLIRFKEEAGARIIAFREQRAAPSLSAGSNQLAVQLVHNQNPVRSRLPRAVVILPGFGCAPVGRPAGWILQTATALPAARETR